MTSSTSTNKIVRNLKAVWKSSRVTQVRAIVSRWKRIPYSGTIVLLLGTLLATAFIMTLDRSGVLLTNPGLVYLPLVAMLAYHWGWRYAVAAAIFELFCVYFFFLPPTSALKSLNAQTSAQLLVLAAVTGFTLALVQLARQRRANAEHAAGRLAALNRIGTALASELDETRLLHLIAETARELTGAGFAAFTLRPVNEIGQPLVPSEGHLFHLAAVVGVTKEQEELFRHMPLGGEGLLAPVFHHAMPVRVADALAYVQRPQPSQTTKFRAMSSEHKKAARQAAFDYAHGHLSGEGLRSMGVPRGHPIVRSFLGAPLLDRAGNVRGGLLLGHTEPDQFTKEDEELLVGLAAEAAIALENAQLYSAAQSQAQELDAIFESIADGITLVDDQGNVLRENRTARRLRETLESSTRQIPGQFHTTEAILQESAAHALSGEREQVAQITIADDHKDSREYTLSSSPLRPSTTPPATGESEHTGNKNNSQSSMNGAVVVWHDVTEANRLLTERQAHAETEARRALLQTVIDELPSGVYLVRGRDARLVLANRAATEVWGALWIPGQSMGEFLAANGIRVFHFDGRPLALTEFATLRAVQKGESVRHHQEIIRHRDGTTLPVLVNAVTLDPQVLGWSDSGKFGESNEPGEANAAPEELEPAAIVVHQDVTALKEAERVKDEFIGIAAHELRTPLAVIKGFAQTLLIQTAKGRGPELADWQTEAIQDIDQATSRLVELTEDLLDVTRLQAGRLELHTEPTDLVALGQRIVARFQVTTEDHHISINAMPEHIVSNIDPRRTEQVLSNLINNAVKYSPDGGDIEVTVREDQKTNTVLLYVRDHGMGIPANQQGRIFGRFMRADNARSNNIGGTGLGLYLCRELVERQGGRIWFESLEGEGSTFFVSLPLMEGTD